MSAISNPYLDYESAKSHLSEIFDRCRIATVSEVKVALEPHYFAMVSANNRFAKRPFRNQATESHLHSFIADGLLRLDNKKMDSARVPPVYDGYYFLRRRGDLFPADELADAFCKDWDRNTRRIRQELLIRPDCFDLTMEMHEWGSEFNTVQIVLTSIWNYFGQTKNKEFRELRKTWQLKDLPKDIDDFDSNYSGDAIVGDGLTVCCPFMPKHWKDPSRLKDFLISLDQRLGCSRYLLFSPFGFKTYQKKQNKSYLRKSLTSITMDDRDN